MIGILAFFFLYSQAVDTAAIDRLFADWDQPGVPGCALGVIHDGQLIYARGYGMANLEYDIPNTPNSVFRIGSTSKQFTAACIVLLAERGKLSLDNTLDSYFPDFPAYAKKITIRHLLNHSSGIRDYLRIADLKGLRDEADFYRDRDVMQWLIRQQTLNFEPGSEFLYSNSGYWLLGQIVTQVAGEHMADFARKEFFEPLGMTNTHFHNDHTQIVKTRASGYAPTGPAAYRISMTTLDMIGDGGIFTTIEDIKKWDDAYYEPDVLSPQFWEMMTEQGVLNNGDTIEYASGLVIGEYKGLKTIDHGGAFVGFRATLVRFPGQRFSVAIFANRADADPSARAYQVADLFLQDQFEEEEMVQNKEEDSAASAPEYELSQLTGTYELVPGANINIHLENDSLRVIQSWDKASFHLKRLSGNAFQVQNGPPLRLSFSELRDGSTQVLTVYQNGNPRICNRKKEIDISRINLADYSGNYYSEELDVTYHLFVEKDVLKLTVRNDDPTALTVYDIDQFSLPGMLIRFGRQDEKVSGFELDAGRARNIKFFKD